MPHESRTDNSSPADKELAVSPLLFACEFSRNMWILGKILMGDCHYFPNNSPKHWAERAPPDSREGHDRTWLHWDKTMAIKDDTDSVRSFCP